MLKSTAGGGGIGMRICYHEEELVEAFASVCRLAEANFNNGGVFLEKYIERARHIEVQIFGNLAGEVVALGERDCSIQRRNQKVVEESPAPLLSQVVRQQMFDAAVALGKAVNYRSAGTVEFLYDAQTEQFYFLEVNTRLQVETPHSEAPVLSWLTLFTSSRISCGADWLFPYPFSPSAWCSCSSISMCFGAISPGSTSLSHASPCGR